MYIICAALKVVSVGLTYKILSLLVNKTYVYHLLLILAEPWKNCNVPLLMLRWRQFFQNLEFIGHVWLVGVVWAPLDGDFESHIIA
jgi:hypothetical protein